METVIYSNGDCNDGSREGWWKTVVVSNMGTKVLKGSAWNTTCNRMEIQAIIEGLKDLQGQQNVIVICDSSYILGTMTEGWDRRKNGDLWFELSSMSRKHRVKYQFGTYES
jgi:ribonuclease HI